MAGAACFGLAFNAGGVMVRAGLERPATLDGRMTPFSNEKRWIDGGMDEPTIILPPSPHPGPLPQGEGESSSALRAGGDFSGSKAAGS
jgi:hypothetical protein